MLEPELGHPIPAALVCFGPGEQPVQLAEVDHGVHRFQSIRAGHGEKLAVGADQRLELGGGFFGDHPIQGERYPHKLVPGQCSQLFGGHFRNESDIDLVERRNTKHLPPLEERKASRQQLHIN